MPTLDRQMMRLIAEDAFSQGPTDVLGASSVAFVPSKLADPPPHNPSGIRPTEFKVLVEPDPTEEVTKGGIIIPVEKAEKDKYATTDGTIVAISHLAFTYASDDEWGNDKPKAGDRIAFAKYAGVRRKGKDGKDYLLINDKDVVAVIES